jgi:hypothetical protein
VDANTDPIIFKGDGKGGIRPVLFGRGAERIIRPRPVWLRETRIFELEDNERKYLEIESVDSAPDTQQ